MPTFYAYLAGLAAALAGALGPTAAQTLPSPGPRTCATPQAAAQQQAQLVRRLPGYRAVLATRGAARPQAATATTYTLPVVVHVIYDGEAVGTGTNLSQAQVQSQLDVLNEDYRNRNADGTLVPSVFQPLRGDAQFQFQLAGIDPLGRPMAEPGIDRVDRHAQGWAAPPYGSPSDLAYIENVIKPQTSWNPDNYVNIWVMSLGGNLLGYAQLPDNTAGLGGLYPQGGLAATDGVVIQYAAFGRVGTLAANYDRGRTTTHELGHFLGLRHTWGDADCGDDYVADTPTQQTSDFGCPAFPHVSCSNGPNGDMFMNFLDYVNDACMQLFSRGQADRMQAVMAAGTPRRSSLPASPALCPSRVAATATNSGLPCGLGTLSLSATGPAGATYAWNGPNGFSSSQQNPVLLGATTAALGTYSVLVSAPAGCPSVATTTVSISPPVWTGAAGDGDWFNAANWQGCVPTRSTDALVPVLSGAPYPTITSGAAEVRTLTVQGTLNLRGGSLLLYGDFGGLGSFAQTGGQVVTLGTGAQRLRGGAYLDLIIGGAGTKTIGSSTIGQRLLLSGGVLSTGPDSVALAPTATLTGETDASYVLGLLRTTRTVGLGPETFGNLGVSLAAGFVPGTTTVRRTTGTALAGSGNAGIARYYDIRPATSRGLQGATLALAYLPHELNGLPESSLALFRLPPGSADFANEGATARDASARLVTRAYVTDLAGRWTLASTTTPLAPVASTLILNAFPVPFATEGLALQVTTPTAGPLTAQVFDVLGRRLYDRTLANVEVGTSTVSLPGTEQLSPGKYIMRVQQAGQQVRLNVVRQ
ncbi:T9SS type A sorting domain-containing protein [Hymenobacter sp. RP-2-7]|uniref:T9SS type A sorting domain-containing protein n=1 Tax=Hymenobacter polaris TaxID=2682546 RepID=A0A7Y0FMA4_9BACT|nr:M43 family zinc metalloprotease [Hymenobacter polaris]NML65622.1 T9SS type A sorting domain-containing protein [Hymenobacter polaris]